MFAIVSNRLLIILYVVYTRLTRYIYMYVFFSFNSHGITDNQETVPLFINKKN